MNIVLGNGRPTELQEIMANLATGAAFSKIKETSEVSEKAPSKMLL